MPSHRLARHLLLLRPRCSPPTPAPTPTPLRPDQTAPPAPPSSLGAARPLFATSRPSTSSSLPPPRRRAPPPPPLDRAPPAATRISLRGLSARPPPPTPPPPPGGERGAASRNGAPSGRLSEAFRLLRELASLLRDPARLLRELAALLRVTGDTTRLLGPRILMTWAALHCVYEYGADLIMCEGPSMLPTFRTEGEIVLLDKCTHRFLGLDDGDRGEERRRRARVRQLEWESRRRRGGDREGRGEDGDDDDDDDDDAPVTWHRPLPRPVDEPPLASWSNLWQRLTTGISAGDLVIMLHPKDNGTICKRVVGLPGDVVVRPGGDNLTYAASRRKAQMLFEDLGGESGVGGWTERRRVRLGRRGRDEDRSSLVVVPDGHVWVEGDNSVESRDSREHGPIPAAMVVGRVVCRVWPPGGGRVPLGRGGRPVPAGGARFSGSTVMPAGYEGEEMVPEGE